MTEDKKPCGEYHPLPCGLDKKCPVPVCYHHGGKDNETIVSEWEG